MRYLSIIWPVLTGASANDKISTNLLKGIMRLLETPKGKTVALLNIKGKRVLILNCANLAFTPGKEVKYW